MEPPIGETHRSRHPAALILPTVIHLKGSAWNAATQAVATTDSQRVLEALVAEYGVDASIAALDNQGFRGESYRYLLNPLHEEALRRRAIGRAGQ